MTPSSIWNRRGVRVGMTSRWGGKQEREREGGWCGSVENEAWEDGRWRWRGSVLEFKHVVNRICHLGQDEGK